MNSLTMPKIVFQNILKYSYKIIEQNHLFKCTRNIIFTYTRNVYLIKIIKSRKTRNLNKTINNEMLPWNPL